MAPLIEVCRTLGAEFLRADRWSNRPANSDPHTVNAPGTTVAGNYGGGYINPQFSFGVDFGLWNYIGRYALRRFCAGDRRHDNRPIGEKRMY